MLAGGWWTSVSVHFLVRCMAFTMNLRIIITAVAVAATVLIEAGLYILYFAPSYGQQQYSNTNLHPARTLTPKHLYTIPRHSRSWKNGSFCHDFLETTFREQVPVCDPENATSGDRISCLRSPHSVHMATCTIHNLVVAPHKLYWSLVSPNSTGLGHSKSTWLMDSDDNSCPAPSITHLANTMETGDYVRVFVEELIDNKRRKPAECSHWIDEPTFLFASHDFHIYFRFLAWYSLFKSLMDNKVQGGDVRIYRITGGANYLFPEYERQLFPELQVVAELPLGVTCFRKAIIVPKTYATVLFQCKMHYSMWQQCYDCIGKELNGTSLSAFRQHILHTCGIEEHSGSPRNVTSKARKTLVIILRKAYMRHSLDELHDFQRVLSNEEEMIAALNESLPNTNVLPLYMEELPICDQIRHAHMSDVLLGVHGAGLVHMWWLRDDATGIELEPFYQAGNPTFKMLTTLTGRNYHSISIRGSMSHVDVDVNEVVHTVKKYIKG